LWLCQSFRGTEIQVMRSVKIGLALGSGSARGWSHIGVINALQRAGIQIDVVAGCSIGSLVGAAFACGKLQELEGWVRSFSYWDVLKLMDLSWRRGGLLRGERVFNHYRQLLPASSFTDCQLKFGAVATNLSTGRELWFTEGDLHLAVRASCSMPGLMAPVAHNGYWLVDGAVVNPVPVSLTRALGADIVIAVDLQHDAHLMQQDLLSVNLAGNEDGTPGETLRWHERLRERIGMMSARQSVAAPTAMEIMTTSIQVLENRLKRNRMAGDPPDILLQPLCPQISTLDFHRAEAAINSGQLAVEKKIDELLPLARTVR
jgi:NTE family protein